MLAFGLPSPNFLTPPIHNTSSSCLRIGICSSARAFAFLLLQNPFQSVLGLRVVLSCVLGYLTRYVLHVNTCPFTVYMVWILHLHSIWPALFSRNLCCGPWYLSWLYVTTWLCLRAYYHDHCPRQRSHLKQPYRLSLLFYHVVPSSCISYCSL